MKLKQIKNDGIWKKKEIPYPLREDETKMFDKSRGYNQAKAELSEVELVVDIGKLTELIYEYQGNCGDQIEALASSMSEWLRLERGKE